MSDWQEPPPLDYENLLPPEKPPDWLLADSDQFVMADGFHDLNLDDDWHWHDAALIGIDHGAEAGDKRYEIGVVDLYADLDSGDLGGSYLKLASLGDEDQALNSYYDFQDAIAEQRVLPFQLPQFAEDYLHLNDMGDVRWQGAEPIHYTAYEHSRSLQMLEAEISDDPPEVLHDTLLQTVRELGGELVFEPPEEVQKALNSIGVQINTDEAPTPLIDEETNTAYWIGIFQDDENPEQCLTSILSLGRDETGELQAQLAPCLAGDYETAFQGAEYLLNIAEKSGIDGVFDAAQAMALGGNQHQLWQSERGVPLDQETAQEIAEATRDNWQVEL